MKKAAALGVVDFKDAKLLDRSWWRRLNWLLEELAVQEAQELLKLKFDQHSCALNYTAGKTFDHHWKILNDIYERWLQISIPAVGKTKKNSASLMEEWRRAYSHLSDEELAVRAEETGKALRQNRGPEQDPARRGWAPAK